jgi:hypothetical protein
VKNIGDDDIEIVFMEPTGEQSETPEGHTAPFATDPECYKILADSDGRFVAEMAEKAGEEVIACFSHTHRVCSLLTLH